MRMLNWRDMTMTARQLARLSRRAQEAELRHRAQGKARKKLNAFAAKNRSTVDLRPRLRKSEE